VRPAWNDPVQIKQILDTGAQTLLVPMIQSADEGSILIIPREGGYLVRIYVELDKLAADERVASRNITLDQLIAAAQRIMRPHSLEVKEVAWWSVYEIGQRLTDKFDDVPVQDVGTRLPRVFIAGDACHTHSAKAGQGMNVSMQDGFNLGWKLGSVLTGRAPESLLATYGAERRPVAQQLIDFDREWSSLMARKPEEISDPNDLATYYLATAEFPSGFMTQYTGSMITGTDAHQELAVGYPLGKRFKSAEVVRVGDGNVVHLGHHAKADGRWRVYAFGDRTGEALTAWAEAAAPVFARFTPADGDEDAVFDVKAVYPQPFEEVEVTSAPALFQPKTGPLGLTDWEKVYAAGPSKWCATDIFEARELSRDGVVVVVRPDQYVAAIFPLDGVAELEGFLEGAFLPAR
ncbi:MAG: 3-hydroxybenzoate 4-monooxygenase, partial [Microbacterium sp.]|nr:3-hydroxybenzoate 4-monooxygenase [Microbacterium sp.]